MAIEAAKDPSSMRARGRHLGGYLEMARDLAHADAATLLLRESSHGGLVLCARDGNGCAAGVISAAAPFARQPGHPPTTRLPRASSGRARVSAYFIATW
jgi:hypothetical protein